MTVYCLQLNVQAVEEEEDADERYIATFLTEKDAENAKNSIISLIVSASELIEDLNREV